MAAKKVFSWLASGLLGLYAVQVVTVGFWECVPMEQREVQGIRYEIRKGWGFPWALIPLLGVSPVVDDEPVRLITTDLASGRRVETSHDVADDVRKKHPKVWPDGR